MPRRIRTLRSSPQSIARVFLRFLTRIPTLPKHHIGPRVRITPEQPNSLQLKWEEDCKYLPLTDAHRALYEIIHRHFAGALGHYPDLVECRDFNDRMQWLKLFDQSTDIIRCSDKILVRDYIQERVGTRHLVELFQTHDHFDQIEFSNLPSSFVIKANHDSGTVVLVRDAASFDKAAARGVIEQALGRTFGGEYGEWAYKYVKPRVLVEEFIEPENSVPPPDYKFYCVHGNVKFMHYIYDRGHGTKEQTIDRFGNDLRCPLHEAFELGTGFRKPKMWDEMIHIAERVSSEMKFVRVDMYSSGERILVGEMTFWPATGIYGGEGQKRLGQLLDFDRSTYKPFLLP
jgi:hypothetical protein